MGFHCCLSRSPAASWRTPRQRPLQPNASLACTTAIPRSTSCCLPRSFLAVRPLTDDEIVVCRSFSLQTLTATRQPAAWALAEATARTSEIHHIVVSDLDFMNRRVWIHGSSKTEARWGFLSDWGATQLAGRVGDVIFVTFSRTAAGGVCAGR